MREMDERLVYQVISFFDKSMGFLKIAHIASLQKDEKTFSTDHYQNTIAYLCYHSFELFLKFCILAKCSDRQEFERALDKFDHNITKLYDKYTTLYKNKKYKIDHPFDFTVQQNDIYNVGEAELYANHIKKYPMHIIDQYLKYPFDRNGKYTGGACLFFLDSKWIENFSDDMNNIALEIISDLLDGLPDNEVVII